jgi:hypothetical protein
MDIEDLDLNPFFFALRNVHTDIWNAASSNGWLLCIPQASSLRGGTARIDIESHVLQPSRSFPGEFLTLTGNVVTVVGSEIHTKSGFLEPRTVKILYTEEFTEEENIGQDINHSTYPSTNARSTNTRSQAIRQQQQQSGSMERGNGERVFSIIHIGRPLIGGVNAPSSADEMSRSIIVKYMAMLRSFPEHESVMLRLDDFVKRTNEYLRNNELPGSDQLEKLLTRELDHAVGTLMNSSCFVDSSAKSSNVNRRKTKTQLSQVLESYLLEGIHARVFSRLSEQCREEDLTLTRILDGMSMWTQSDLKMRPEFQCPLNNAVQILSNLSLDCVTPLEKLLCLKRVHDEINRSVEKNLTSRYLDIGAHQMTTDDLLDQLIYAIIKARQLEVSVALEVVRREEQQSSSSRYRSSSGNSSSSSSSNHSNSHGSGSINSGSDGSDGSDGYSSVAGSKTRREIIINMRFLSLRRSFLSTNIQYMQKFHLINLNTTVLGYNLANLEVAIGWFILKRTRIAGPLWSAKRKVVRDDETKEYSSSSSSSSSSEEKDNCDRSNGGGCLVLIGEGGETSHHVGRRGSPTPLETPPSSSATRKKKKVNNGDDGDIVDVACSSHTFCKIDAKGQVYTWGAGNMSNGTYQHSPTSAMSLAIRQAVATTPSTKASTPIMRKSLFVKCLSAVRLFLLLLFWGGNTHVCNFFNSNFQFLSFSLSFLKLPSSSLFGDSVHAVQVSCGMHHVIVRDQQGNLHAW